MGQFLIDILRRFRRREEGNVSVEVAFYLPFLLGIFAATYTLFDLFRQETVNTKAAYTISDLISRETAALNDDYIDSMFTLAQLLVRSDSGMSMRVSVIRWDEDDNRYYVDWSVERGDLMNVWTDGTVSDIEAKLPTMPDQERVILVETWNNVEPAFNIGFSTRNIYNFVFTRPRFASLVAFEGEIFSDGTIHDDEIDDSVM
ncbi:TadE/TadG family type IV pilus assembly protein [Phaeobacter sp. B1627]|uniref:TadE/TadG family type IV pilus assembly protein n=1 Tax=Phaeobacter sp. B1627 TaxID=2583809 RepID=UPI0011199B48|nr:pilus assembly protein [Phaeobacter sp. B1627]TNJ41812.1 pilus assembly protein [Phaeobacter sp. B1627]